MLGPPLRPSGGLGDGIGLSQASLRPAGPRVNRPCSSRSGKWRPPWATRCQGRPWGARGLKPAARCSCCGFRPAVQRP